VSPTRVKVMGVVNVTDDSFSDGGLFLDRDRAVEHGLALAADGAAIVDVGGESTRPGAAGVDPAVETARILPVVKDLAAQGITVSIDTMRAEVAGAALEQGAQIVNDVSGGRADPKMVSLVAEAGVPWVLMHWRSVSAARPHEVPHYSDVVADVRDDLLAGVDAAVSGGVDPGKVIIDPGLGFAKTAQHNWALLHALPEFVATGIPVLVGASRKRFLGTLLAGAGREPRPPGGRETATAVISALAALNGAWGVRVHDVQASVDAIKVVAAWTDPEGGSGATRETDPEGGSGATRETDPEGGSGATRETAR
jgi:dihydropteroate synthase